MEFLSIPLLVAERIEVGWTLVLYLTRFTTMMALLPGIGGSISGLTVRLPAILVLSFVSVSTSLYAPVPPDMGIMIAQIVSELLFGSVLGLLPALVVASVQTGMQLASVTMGLGASQLIDPNSGAQLSDISRIYAEVVIIMFLMIGGHHVIIYAASGMGATIMPGTFILDVKSIDLLIDRTARVLHLGMVISAPIIVALLLTQFVMGLITRAVPTVNIFIISYPLTIGIGLILAILSFPEVMHVLGNEFVGIEGLVSIVVEGFSRGP